ncbi:UNVERIFIED_CONTAM: hypothetical protein FKN15_042092 [Acipenser sinensis]
MSQAYEELAEMSRLVVLFHSLTLAIDCIQQADETLEQLQFQPRVAVIKKNANHDMYIVPGQTQTSEKLSKTSSRSQSNFVIVRTLRMPLLGPKVYCGLTSQGQLIAVKQVAVDSSDQATAEKEYQRLQEEVDLLKTLDYSNIVGFLGTCLEVNIMSIFMEFVPGGSVASIINRFGPLPEKVFAIYTKQILEGVEYLAGDPQRPQRKQRHAYAHWYYKTHRFWLCQAIGLFEHDRHQQRTAQAYAWHSILDGTRSHQ